MSSPVHFEQQQNTEKSTKTLQSDKRINSPQASDEQQNTISNNWQKEKIDYDNMLVNQSNQTITQEQNKGEINQITQNADLNGIKEYHNHTVEESNVKNLLRFSQQTSSNGPLNKTSLNKYENMELNNTSPHSTQTNKNILKRKVSQIILRESQPNFDYMRDQIDTHRNREEIVFKQVQDKFNNQDMIKQQDQEHLQRKINSTYSITNNKQPSITDREKLSNLQSKQRRTTLDSYPINNDFSTLNKQQHKIGNQVTRELSRIYISNPSLDSQSDVTIKKDIDLQKQNTIVQEKLTKRGNKQQENVESGNSDHKLGYADKMQLNTIKSQLIEMQDDIKSEFTHHRNVEQHLKTGNNTTYEAGFNSSILNQNSPQKDNKLKFENNSTRFRDSKDLLQKDLKQSDTPHTTNTVEHMNFNNHSRGFSSKRFNISPNSQQDDHSQITVTDQVRQSYHIQDVYEDLRISKQFEKDQNLQDVDEQALNHQESQKQIDGFDNKSEISDAITVLDHLTKIQVADDQQEIDKSSQKDQQQEQPSLFMNNKIENIIQHLNKPKEVNEDEPYLYYIEEQQKQIVEEPIDQIQDQISDLNDKQESNSINDRDQISEKSYQEDEVESQDDEELNKRLAQDFIEQLFREIEQNAVIKDYQIEQNSKNSSSKSNISLEEADQQQLPMSNPLIEVMYKKFEQLFQIPNVQPDQSPTDIHESQMPSYQRLNSSQDLSEQLINIQTPKDTSATGRNIQIESFRGVDMDAQQYVTVQDINKLTERSATSQKKENQTELNIDLTQNEKEHQLVQSLELIDEQFQEQSKDGIVSDIVKEQNLIIREIDSSNMKLNQSEEPAFNHQDLQSPASFQQDPNVFTNNSFIIPHLALSPVQRSSQKQQFSNNQSIQLSLKKQPQQQYDMIHTFRQSQQSDAVQNSNRQSIGSYLEPNSTKNANSSTHRTNSRRQQSQHSDQINIQTIIQKYNQLDEAENQMRILQHQESLKARAQEIEMINQLLNETPLDINQQMSDYQSQDKHIGKNQDLKFHARIASHGEKQNDYSNSMGKHSTKIKNQDSIITLEESFDLKEFLKRQQLKQEINSKNMQDFREGPDIHEFQKNQSMANKRNRPIINQKVNIRVNQMNINNFQIDPNMYKEMQFKAKNKRIADYFQNPMVVLNDSVRVGKEGVEGFSSQTSPDKSKTNSFIDKLASSFSPNSRKNKTPVVINTGKQSHRGNKSNRYFHSRHQSSSNTNQNPIITINNNHFYPQQLDSNKMVFNNISQLSNYPLVTSNPSFKANTKLNNLNNSANNSGNPQNQNPYQNFTNTQKFNQQPQPDILDIDSTYNIVESIRQQYSDEKNKKQKSPFTKENFDGQDRVQVSEYIDEKQKWNEVKKFMSKNPQVLMQVLQIKDEEKISMSQKVSMQQIRQGFFNRRQVQNKNQSQIINMKQQPDILGNEYDQVQQAYQFKEFPNLNNTQKLTYLKKKPNNQNQYKINSRLPQSLTRFQNQDQSISTAFKQQLNDQPSINAYEQQIVGPSSQPSHRKTKSSFTDDRRKLPHYNQNFQQQTLKRKLNSQVIYEANNNLQQQQRRPHNLNPIKQQVYQYDNQQINNYLIGQQDQSQFNSSQGVYSDINYNNQDFYIIQDEIQEQEFSHQEQQKMMNPQIYQSAYQDQKQMQVNSEQDIISNELIVNEDYINVSSQPTSFNNEVSDLNTTNQKLNIPELSLQTVQDLSKTQELILKEKDLLNTQRQLLNQEKVLIEKEKQDLKTQLEQIKIQNQLKEEQFQLDEQRKKLEEERNNLEQERLEVQRLKDQVKSQREQQVQGFRDTQRNTQMAFDKSNIEREVQMNQDDEVVQDSDPDQTDINRGQQVTNQDVDNKIQKNIWEETHGTQQLSGLESSQQQTMNSNQQPRESVLKKYYDWSQSEIVQEVQNQHITFNCENDSRFYKEADIDYIIDSFKARYKDFKAANLIEKLYSKSIVTLNKVMSQINMKAQLQKFIKQNKEVNVKNTYKLLLTCKMVITIRNTIYEVLRDIQKHEQLVADIKRVVNQHLESSIDELTTRQISDLALLLPLITQNIKNNIILLRDEFKVLGQQHFVGGDKLKSNSSNSQGIFIYKMRDALKQNIQDYEDIRNLVMVFDIKDLPYINDKAAQKPQNLDQQNNFKSSEWQLKKFLKLEFIRQLKQQQQ
eukprot:403332283